MFTFKGDGFVDAQFARQLVVVVLFGNGFNFAQSCLPCGVANFAVLQRKVYLNIAQGRIFGVPQIAVFG